MPTEEVTQDDNGDHASVTPPPEASTVGAPRSPVAAHSTEQTDSADELATRDKRRKALSRDSSQRTRDKKKDTADAEAGKAELAEREALLKRDGAALVEILADALWLGMLKKGDPRFGRERAQQIAETWAPLLAPHYDPEKYAILQNLPYILAGAGTAKVLVDYVETVKDSRDHRVVRLETAPPAMPESTEVATGGS